MSISKNLHFNYVPALRDIPDLTNDLLFDALKLIEDFKRKDRQNWMLRRIKFKYLKSAIGSGKELPDKHQKFYLANVEHFADDEKFHTQENITKLFEYLNLGIPNIDNHIFSPNETIKNLLALFNEYNLLQTASANPPEKNLIVEYKDWAWFDLRRYYCPVEADLFNHCGNMHGHESQTILTLRKRVPGSLNLGLPEATFILDTETGSLGEMKGLFNLKPSKEAHRAIIELLIQHSNIKRIVGGGYKPENNFSLLDLSTELTTLLHEHRPDLFT